MLQIAYQRTDSPFGSPVDQLAVFFGRMFSLDHKAGVMPAALALRHLVGMEQFSPRRSSGILGDICQLGDDFHRQVPSTRWEIYLLLDFLLSDAGVREHLREQNGRPEALMASFLQLCRHERDPKNLTVWFRVIRLFLLEYAETVVGAEDVFRTYSAYFPVSMRSSTAPSGITVDDLKSALRGCFSASHLAAGKVLSFLLEKLDQGDAVSVSVKVDASPTPRPASSVRTEKLSRSDRYPENPLGLYRLIPGVRCGASCRADVEFPEVRGTKRRG